MDICITCFHGSNIYELRRLIASLFLNVNMDEIKENLKIQNTKFNEKTAKLEDNKNERYEHICYAAFMDRLNNVKFETLNEYIIHGLKQGFSLIKKPNSKFVIILQVDGLSKDKVPDFEYFYNTLEFNTFKKIICWKFNMSENKFIELDYIQSVLNKNNDIDVETRDKALKKLEDEKFVFNYDTAKLNEEFKKIALDYFNEVYDNKTNLSNILKIYKELKVYCDKFDIDLHIRGSKYHTNVSINRNYCLQHPYSDYIKFLDDDDLSCSINVLEQYLMIIKKDFNDLTKIYHFNVFNRYNFGCRYTSMLMKSIIGKNIEYPYMKIKYINGEDYYFNRLHAESSIHFKNNIPLYYRYSSNDRCFNHSGIGSKKINDLYLEKNKNDTKELFGFEWSDNIIFIDFK